MENLISGNDISLWDFLQLSASFLVTMIVLLSANAIKHAGLNRLLLGTFIVLWATTLVVHKPLATKLFATLLMTTIIVVATAIARKRRLEAG